MKMYAIVEINTDEEKTLDEQFTDLQTSVTVLKNELVGKFDIEGVRLATGDAAQEITDVLYKKVED